MNTIYSKGKRLHKNRFARHSRVYYGSSENISFVYGNTYFIDSHITIMKQSCFSTKSLGEILLDFRKRCRNFAKHKVYHHHRIIQILHFKARHTDLKKR